MQMVLEQISQWLSGRFDENPMFTARLESESKIVLVPKEKAFSKMIQRIELELSQRAGVIDAVVIYETDESYTRLAFKNTILNQPIDDALFRKLS
jgi:outer membrane lipoprotein-sorting protein